jgi:hypothetical protein
MGGAAGGGHHRHGYFPFLISHLPIALSFYGLKVQIMR